ncbi:MAG: phage holin family protein [Haliea sp.]
MPDDSTRQKKGLLASLLTLTDSLLVIAHTRFELLSNELEGERACLLSWLVLTQVALFCLGVGVVLATLALVVALGEAYRVQALAGMAAVFIGTGIAAGWFARRSSSKRPRLFAASLAELKRDHSRPDTSL